jgi:hypothetical protein
MPAYHQPPGPEIKSQYCQKEVSLINFVGKETQYYVEIILAISIWKLAKTTKIIYW